MCTLTTVPDTCWVGVNTLQCGLVLIHPRELNLIIFNYFNSKLYGIGDHIEGMPVTHDGNLESMTTFLPENLTFL